MSSTPGRPTKASPNTTAEPFPATRIATLKNGQPPR